MKADAGVRGTDNSRPSIQDQGTKSASWHSQLLLHDSQKALADFAPRDPFAELGQIGNRRMQYGSDGKIPAKYMPNVEKAIKLAYMLVFNEKFVEVFRRTISKLIEKNLPREAYLNALDKMTIHFAETSTDARVKKFLVDEKEAIRKDRTYQLIPAFTIPVGGRNVYLRDFQFQKDPVVIAGSLMHEASHVAGAPANDLAEIALEAIHIIGYPRK